MNPLSKLLLKASFAGTFAEATLTPLLAAFTEKFGGSILDAGIGFAIFNICTGLFVAVIGQTKWFERNTKNLIFAGFLLAGVCDLLYLLVANKWEFFACQLIMGLAIGMLNPAWDALYSEDTNEDESHSQRWSFWTGGASFVVGLGALVGAIIAYTAGFRCLFIFMATADTLAVYFASKIRSIPTTTT